MPVIPTYDAQAQLDPDTRGMPRVHYDTSEFAAAGQEGRALQGLGGALEAAGAQAQQFQERAAQKQQEQNNWTTGLQSRALDQRLQTAFSDHLNGDTGDGSTFKKGYMAQADQLAQQAFDQMPAGPAKDRAIQSWQLLGKPGLEDRAARAQQKLQGAYSTQQIGQMLDTDQGKVSRDPAQTDVLLQEARFQIMNAQGLTTQQKLAAFDGYQRNILGTELAARYPNDPDGLRMALGFPAQGSAGSTFSRMIGAESSGNPNAVSPKGALGLAQLMPGTAREVAGTMGLHDVADMSDADLRSYFQAHPEVNARIGRTYFNQLLSRYGGDQEAAVIAYNSGPGRADDWLRKGKDDDVLPAETVAYRNKVVGAPGADHPDFHVADSETPEPAPNGSRLTGPLEPGMPGAGLVPYLVKGKDSSSVTNLNPIFSSRIQQALAQAPPEVQQGTTIFSGFRSDERQAQIYQAAVQKYGSEAEARKWAAPPGHSNHNAGQAMDLKFSSPAVQQWWHENADHFGLKFPLSNEAWHIEPKETRGGGGLPSAGLPGGGGTLNPRYASLTFADTQRLVAGAESGLRRTEAAQQQQAKLDTFNTQSLVADDIRSLSSTGKGVDDLDPGRVAAVLGPQKAQQWQEKRADALQVFSGTSGMESMTNDQLAQHAEQFRPGPQDAGVGYGRKADVYQSIHEHAQALLKQRAEDPVSAVATAPNVRAAQARISGGDESVAAHENLIQARLAAQGAIGVPSYVQSPVTLDEAKLYAAKMRPLAAEQAQAADQAQVIDGIVQEIGEKYGRYAPDVLHRVLYQVTLKRGAADVLAKALQHVQGAAASGSLVSAYDGYRVDGEQRADTLARQSGAVAVPSAVVPQPAASIAAPDGSVMRAYDSREMPASFEGASTSMLDMPPARKGSYLDAVDALRKNPDDLMPFFVKRYGPDRVPSDLRGRTGAQAR